MTITHYFHVSGHKTSTGASFLASRYVATKEEAEKEKKDLENRGFTVEVYEYNN
jgi:hypothetical protein